MIVCLDQCAISALAFDHAKEPVVADLRRVLIEGCREGDVICPIAQETLLESSYLPREKRDLLLELHLELAHQKAFFKPFMQILKEETLALARSSAPPNPIQLAEFNLPDEEAVQLVRTIYDEGKALMEERVLNTPMPEIDGKPTLHVTFSGTLLEQVGHLYRQIQRLLRGDNPDPDDFTAYDLALYLVEHRITPNELKKLSKDLLHHRWTALPVVFYRSRLGAQLEVDWRRKGNPKKWCANDEIDIQRLTVALNGADLVVTDHAMFSLWETTKLVEYSGTRVVGMRSLRDAIDCIRKRSPAQ